MSKKLEYVEFPENSAGASFPFLWLPPVGRRDAYSKRHQIPLNKLPEMLSFTDQLQTDRDLALTCIETWFAKMDSAIETYISRVRWNPPRQPLDEQRQRGYGLINEYLAASTLTSKNRSSFEEERDRLSALVYQVANESGESRENLQRGLVVLEHGAEPGSISGWELNPESPVIAKLA